MLNAMSPLNQHHSSPDAGGAVGGGDAHIANEDRGTGVAHEEAASITASPTSLTTSDEKLQQQNPNENIPVTSSTSVQATSSEATTVISPSSSTSTSSTAANLASRHPNRHHQSLHNNGPPHYVDLHVNVGERVSLQLLDGQERVVTGPTTIKMISQQPNPPVPVPVQVPPGHMIHQIADENGTLKHIILSVMDSVGDETLESTVITLPQGTFRIDSNGELVCTTGGTGSDNVIPLTTLPQQPYFANYDGCPVAYDAHTLPDSLEISASIAPPDSKSKSGDQQRINNKHQILSSSQTTVPSQMPHSTATSNVNDGQLSGKDVASSGTGANSEAEQMVYQKSNSQSNVAIVSSSETASSMYTSPVTTTTNTPTVTATAAAHHNQELELMNGGQIVPTPMLTTVDGQLYGYPPAACCCCCSYCDPTQEAASQALVQPPPQDYHPEMILAPPSEPASAGSNTRMSSRGSGSNLNVETSMVNGIPQMQYGVPAIMGPSMHHQTSMASLHGATTVTPPVGLPTLTSGTPSIANGGMNHHSRLSMTTGQISSSCGDNSSNIKIHCGPRGSMAGGRGPNGYNKHNNKLSNAASLGNNQNIADRPYMNHYQNHNNILCDQHYHDYHHNDVAGSTMFAGQHKSHSMSNHKGLALSSSSGSSGGFYPPSYNNSHHHHHHHHHHNSSSTSTMASIVSSSINNKSQQQQQHSTPSYRSSESGSENLQQHHSRNNPREQVSYNMKTQHSNNNDNKRQISNDSKLMSHHHQNHNHNHPHHNHQHQNNQHNVNSNRYATNVKVISNSSHSTIAPISSQTAVSPIRTRMKGNNNPPMSTSSSSSNGVRPMSGGHFNHHHHHHQIHCNNSPHDIMNSNNKDTATSSLSHQTTPVTHISSSAVSSQYYYHQQQPHHLHNQQRELQNLKGSSPSTSTSYANAHSHQQENLNKHINQSSYNLNNTHNRNNTGAWQGTNKIVQQSTVIKNNPEAISHEEVNRTSSKGNQQEVAAAATARPSAQMFPKELPATTAAKVQQQDVSGNDGNTEQNTSRASRVKQKKCQISNNNTTNNQMKNPSNQKRSQAPPKQQSSTSASIATRSTAESTTHNPSASKAQESKAGAEDSTSSVTSQDQGATCGNKTAELALKGHSHDLECSSESIDMRSSSLKGRLTKQHEEPIPDVKPNVQLELIKDDILVVSMSESPPTATNTLSNTSTSKQTKHQQLIRTSLSENNIKSLEVSSLVENSSNTTAVVKSTQTTPQKIASSLTSSNSGSNLESSSMANNLRQLNPESSSNIWMNVSTSSPTLRKKSTGGDKQQQPQQQRKSSNAKSEQKTVPSSSLKKASNSRSTQRGSSDTLSSLDSQQASTLSHHHQHSDTSAGIGSNNVNRGNSSSHHSNSGGKSNSQPIKFSNLFKQCRSQFIASLNKLVKNSLSSYSDTKFAGILLVLFTTFAILLALFIHLYIVAPVNE